MFYLYFSSGYLQNSLHDSALAEVTPSREMQPQNTPTGGVTTPSERQKDKVFQWLDSRWIDSVAFRNTIRALRRIPRRAGGMRFRHERH